MFKSKVLGFFIIANFFFGEVNQFLITNNNIITLLIYFRNKIQGHRQTFSRFGQS